jgi:hypothetical protein
VIDCDDEGRPVCITWATPACMLRDLLRFSHLILLGAQCRQYNVHHFPYSSIVMLNEENKICNGCETLLIEESTESYGNMINAFKQMGPRWDPSSATFFGKYFESNCEVERAVLFLGSISKAAAIARGLFFQKVFGRAAAKSVVMLCEVEIRRYFFAKNIWAGGCKVGCDAP